MLFKVAVLLYTMTGSQIMMSSEVEFTSRKACEAARPMYQQLTVQHPMVLRAQTKCILLNDRLA